jgi:hypothetical protein
LRYLDLWQAKPVTPRDALAAYFERQSMWRRRRAQEHTDDPRNEQSAEALAEVADYLRSLPMDHPCVKAVDAYDAHFPGRIGESGLEVGSASYPATRIGFGGRERFDPRQELSRYIEQGLADQLQDEPAKSDRLADLRHARVGVRTWLAAEGYFR